jgi:hypothetical protein
MLITILATIFIIYILTLVSKAQVKKLSPKITNIIRYTFFALAPILITTLILRSYEIYPRGYWFPRVLFWIVIFLMMILYGVCDKATVTKFERVLYGIVFYIPLLYIPVLFIPFLGIGMFLIFYSAFIGDSSKIVYADSNIRIEEKYIGFMGPPPPLVIYEKHGLLSYKELEVPMEHYYSDNTVKITRLDETTYSITRHTYATLEVPYGIEEIKFTINQDD